MQAEFANLSCIDASSMVQPEHHGQPVPLSGYALKVYALYATRFEEVLLLDCDSMPIINPQDAFDSPEFRCAECLRLRRDGVEKGFGPSKSDLLHFNFWILTERLHQLTFAQAWLQSVPWSWLAGEVV